ncbi:type II toxin-antitoxin system RelE/ParE family toxin [Ochrobactrum sp. GPK 3]|uniref:type II toxin-antitoxin system RelE family toxin n=1 Tax=Brucella sp. 22210 TaxID=3453892 RepID=UPI0031385EDC
MAWTIEYARSVQTQLRKIDPQIRSRLRSYMETRIAPLDNPRQIGKALQGSQLGNLWRYRISDYRIICQLQDQRLVVLVVGMGHRKEVYR